VAYGNLGARPDLNPLFGPMTSEENDRLLDRLTAIDARLTQLATEATAHVRVEYKPTGLGLFVRSRDAEVAGGPSGEAGDIWFELRFTHDERTGKLIAPPWTIESRIVVFCCDGPEPSGSSNTHDLARLIHTADTPDAALDVLESHIEEIAAEIGRHESQVFTHTPHAQLP
jgi:hypothetical protein